MTSSSTSSLSLPPVPPDNKFRVLLLEDDTEFAAQILSFLARTGFDCRHALSSQAGTDAFTQVKPHLVLSESQTAGVDGLTFCRWVRETSGIPVVMMGSNDEASEIAALKTGADDYIALPLRPAILMARVVAHLRRAYRYNAPPKFDNPFGLPVEDEETTGALPSGWASCELCGYQGPRSKYEKEDWLGNIKMICPNCKSSDHVVISID
ncbi:transcriptional regulatory protein AfsQ1 [Abditibacteriota bacterium]|nr:transcriptional regulatory protein AfsQ1 [Abditibacteriota bacterium]